jgi:hypothetical protein
MATFGGLYDFPDLLDGQLELSSPPDSSDSDESDESACSVATEDEEDAWYNLPSDLEDEDDDSIAPGFTLPLRPLATSTAFTMPDIIRKEHSTGARIKAIYMLEQRRSAGDIKKAIGVSRTRVYELASLAR